MFENLGNARFMRGRLKQAVKAFEMAVWRDPANVRAWKNLALTYQRVGDQRNLQRAWLQIRKIAPNDPDVQKVFGQHS